MDQHGLARLELGAWVSSTFAVTQRLLGLTIVSNGWPAGPCRRGCSMRATTTPLTGERTSTTVSRGAGELLIRGAPFGSMLTGDRDRQLAMTSPWFTRSPTS